MKMLVNVLLACNEIYFLNIDININLDNDFDKNDSGTIIFIRLLAWHIDFEKHKEI